MDNLFKQTAYLLVIFSVTLFAISCGSNVTEAEMDETVREGAVVTLQNRGAQAYIISSINGDGVEAEIGANNPDMIMEIGRRYTFQNEAGASSHPLEFRNADREILFGQRGTGLFGDNPDVDVVRSGDAVTFTLTPELAAVLADYVCSFHPGMNGGITTVE